MRNRDHGDDTSGRYDRRRAQAGQPNALQVGSRARSAASNGGLRSAILPDFAATRHTDRGCSGQPHEPARAPEHAVPSSPRGRSASSDQWQSKPTRAGDSAGGTSSDLRASQRDALLIHVSLDAGSDLLECVHSFVTGFAASRFRPSISQALSIAAYELIENGLKYGSIVQPVVFELYHDGNAPEVWVSNAAVSSRISMLSARVDALARDPEGTYLEELRRSIGGAGQRAMLGLARVAHEAKMAISMSTEGQRVVVRARCAR